NSDHVESHLAIAKFALIAEMWHEAREHLAAASSEQPDDALPARICRYMAELEEGENRDLEASREWLKKAAVAEPDSVWNCSHCGQVVADWDPLCRQCETFDSLEWRTPPRVTRMGPVEKEITSSNLNEKSTDESSKTIDITPDAAS
ncbi:hypothetical protein OAJ93_04565, partial [Gammaproteobacteria bacterium]|nr:hypothetical protein [Gammaproteobacteria bacterium]